jgi:hypothetical protein
MDEWRTRRIDPLLRQAVQLLLALDGINIMECWRDDDVIAIPMQQWAEITHAVNVTLRQPHGLEVRRVTDAVRAVNQERAYDRRTRTICLSIEQLTAILVAQREMHASPEIVAAYASEYYKRHGRFPGQPDQTA